VHIEFKSVNVKERRRNVWKDRIKIGLREI
jgi:hypothetical protein